MIKNTNTIKKIIDILNIKIKDYSPTLITTIIKEYGKDPFLVLICCLLSLRAKDIVTIHVCKDLLKIAKTPQQILDTPTTKLEKIIFHTKEERQVENLRKMIIAMSEDVRIIIVKLADRLHNMRTLSSLGKEKMQLKSLETLEVYSPIAHRLGIFQVKSELEDLSFKYLYPRQYEKINKLFKQKLLSGKNPGLSYNEKCFRQMIRGVKMTSPCGAGKSYAGINYKGEIFPCHRFVQWPEWKMGDVWNGITRPEIRNITKDFNINLSNPKCASCDNGFCGGTCLAANYENNGSIWIPSKDGCRISKKQWDNAKKLYNELKDTQQFKKIYSRYQSVKVNSKKPKNYVNLSSLNERLNKMEKTVYSMSQVLLDIAEKEENTNG